MEEILIGTDTYYIYKHINTFMQTDQNIRSHIHNMIIYWMDQINRSFDILNNLFGIFLGGEMYIYGKIFDKICSKKLYLTDTNSIYIDAKNNDPSIEKSQYEIINYTMSDSIINKIKLDRSEAHFLIANVSKNGLGKNLTDQINQFKPLYLILINCSDKSANADRNYLKLSYDLIDQMELISNHIIVLSLLKLKTLEFRLS